MQLLTDAPFIRSGPVIWNPWHEQARDMADFGDDEYPNMVCVEAGHVSSPVILLPGTAFEASQILQVSKYTQPLPCVAGN